MPCGLATDWMTGESVFDSGRIERFFSSLPILRPIQLPIHWIPPWVKCLGREAGQSRLQDNSSSSSSYVVVN